MTTCVVTASHAPPERHHGRLQPDRGHWPR
jgi:hypothetical protein